MSRGQVDLGSRGSAFWDAVQAEFEFDERESELLLEACRTMDAIDALVVAVAENGTMIEGSKGQPTLNPAIPELRQQQAALGRLLGQLDLDDEDADVLRKAQQLKAHAAAQARWRERKASSNG